MPYDSATPQRGRRRFLSQRKSLALDNAEGTTIAVDSGCLWVTMERDPRDVVLLPGMSFEIDRSGHTIIAAEEDSRFRLRAVASAPNRAPAWLGRLAKRLSLRWAARACHSRRLAAPYY